MYIHIQFSSVTHSYATLCHPIDCSMPDFPVHHQLLSLLKLISIELGVAIQQAHPLLSHSPPVFNLSQHQGIFKWKMGSSHQVAKVLKLQLQHPSFQWKFRTDFLYPGLVGSPWSNCPRDSQESSPTPQLKASILWHSAFFLVQLSHPYMTTGKTIVLTRQTFVGKVMSLVFNTLSRLVITLLPKASIF